MTKEMYMKALDYLHCSMVMRWDCLTWKEQRLTATCLDAESLIIYKQLEKHPEDAHKPYKMNILQKFLHKILDINVENLTEEI